MYVCHTSTHFKPAALLGNGITTSNVSTKFSEYLETYVPDQRCFEIQTRYALRLVTGRVFITATQLSRYMVALHHTSFGG